MDYSPPGSAVHGIFQAKILECVAISCSRGSSWLRDWACVSWLSCIGRWILYHYATWEAQVKVDQEVTQATEGSRLWNVVVVQSLSCVQLFVTSWTSARQASLSFHHLPELAQTHVHRVGDAIQPSHPLSSPSPPALNLSQHQGLFKWVNPLHEVAKVLEFQLQHQSFWWNIQGWFPLGLTILIYLQSKRLSRVFYNTTGWKHQFFSTQTS